MTTLLASPAHRIADGATAEMMAGTDPYSLGFCLSSYHCNTRGEIARYAIGEGLTAFISYQLSSGFALVVQDGQGREIFGSRMADTEAVRASLAGMIR